MNQDNQFSSPAIPLNPLQPPPQGQKRLRNSDSHPSPTNKCERVFVTVIRTTNVASGLRRVPAGFHVIVEVDGRIIQTSNKPVSTQKDTVEWDEDILLPSNQSSSISFSVYASFELGPRLGNGELLGQFKITVGEVFHHRNDQLQLIYFTVQKDDTLPSCLSLSIITERRICDTNESCPKVDLPEPREMTALEQLTDEGHCALRRYRQRPDQMDLDSAIHIFELVLEICPTDHPNRSAVLFNLANAKLIDCQANNRHLALDVPIGLYQDALQLRNKNHPDHCTTVLELGLALFARFQRRGVECDREEARDLLAIVMVVSAADSHAYRAGLFGLQMAVASISVEAGDVGSSPAKQMNSNDMIQKTRDLQQNFSNWNPRRLLGSLGMLLYDRFERNGVLADIHEAISMLEYAVDLTPHGHPDMLSLLSDLGSALSHRFDHLGDLADINRSVSTLEEVVCLTPDGHLYKPGQLNNLGNSLLRRFNRLGDPVDLNRSISMREEAICLTPDGHPDKPAWLNNLGNSLLTQFEHLGDLGDLNKSISVFDEAVYLMADSNPDKSRLLKNLGNSLLSRFDRLGDLTDLIRSISMYEQALCLTPDNHPGKPGRLSDLGNSLLSRFERLGGLVDLNSSISKQEEAVCLMSDSHPDMPVLLDNLGNSLLRRFERLGDLADLIRSISMREKAVSLTPDGHPHKPSRLSNLGNSLSRRFERLGDYADIVKSISINEEAISFTPDGHPDKPILLMGLGDAFNIRYKHSHNSSDLSAASFNFSSASQVSIGHTSTRFRGARAWISCAQLQENSTTLLDACASALNLLPQLAWLGLPVTERHRLLVEAADVTRDSVAAALEAGHPELAVEWLEQGRSIVWTQFLQLRTPVDDLAHDHPALALEFRQISQELGRASTRNNPTFCQPVNIPIVDTRLLEKDIQRHHDLALRREDLLFQIRSLPGFDQFLLLKTIKQLAALAIPGPVVYLTANKERCDALIVMAELEGVIHVPLPGICYQNMEVLRRVLRDMLERHCLVFSRDALYELIPSEDRDRSKKFIDLLLDGDFTDGSDRAVKTKSQRFGGYSPNEWYQVILKLLWNDVVNPVLQALGFSNPPYGTDKMTRIFWCPTGPFSFLPIHAAGLYNTAEAGTKLSDFAISSYLPTLSSLAPSPQNSLDDPFSNLRLLAVPQPPTDGLGRLFSVEDEINSIKELSDKSPFVSLQNSDGTVEDVMEKLKNTDWVHFACHGIQDPQKPLDSGLGLANNRRLKLLDIMQLSRPQGGLAFLSACQTAQGEETLSEESVHLAAGMLLAGYGSVIGTMWAIRDNDAPKVAKYVYAHLFRDAGRVPDSTEAAEALHCAIQHLRDSGAPFTSWVPFIHFGR